MAKALITDDGYGQLALNYYNRFPEEPCFNDITARVDAPELIPQTSLETLLKAIIRSWTNKAFPGSDLVLVCHGNTRGLTMRLFPNHQTDSRTDILKTLMGHESDAQKAQRLKLTSQQVTDLIGYRKKIQLLGLGHVMFRGCTLGSDHENLRTLRDFLWAKSLSGSDVLSTYASIPNIGLMRTTAFDKYIAQQNAVHLSSFPEGRCAFVRVPGQGQQDSVSINVERTGNTDTRAVIIRQWLAKYMSNMTPSLLQTWMLQNLPVHYLRMTPPVLPLEKDYIAHVPRI